MSTSGWLSAEVLPSWLNGVLASAFCRERPTRRWTPARYNRGDAGAEWGADRFVGRLEKVWASLVCISITSFPIRRRLWPALVGYRPSRWTIPRHWVLPLFVGLPTIPIMQSLTLVLNPLCILAEKLVWDGLCEKLTRLISSARLVLERVNRTISTNLWDQQRLVRIRCSAHFSPLTGETHLCRLKTSPHFSVDLYRNFGCCRYPIPR